MGLTKCVLSCVILSCCVHVTISFCMFELPKDHNPKNCTYQDRVVALNDSLEDFERCIRIGCLANGGMHICGIGINAGVFQPPPGCRVIKGDKCAPKLVDVNDNSMECHPRVEE